MTWASPDGRPSGRPEPSTGPGAPQGPSGPASGPSGAGPARRRWLLPVTCLLVVALTAGGLWGGARLREARSRDRLATVLADIHRAFLSGDCAQARALSQTVERPGRLPREAAGARSELGRCAPLEEARAGQGSAGERAMGYLDYLQTAPGAPLDAVARRELHDLVLAAPTRDLAVVRLCSRDLDLERQALTVAVERDRLMPALELACGTLLESLSDTIGAAVHYRRVLTDHPQAAEAPAARRRLAEVLVGQVGPGDQGARGADPIRTDRSLGGKARLLVYNQGPRELEVAVAGPDATVATVAGCAECPPYYGPDVPVRCDWGGTPARLELRPGDYRIVLQYFASGGTSAGRFRLDPDGVYRTCVWAVGSIG